MLYHHYCYHHKCKLLLLLHQTDLSIIQTYLNPKDAQAHLLIPEQTDNTVGHFKINHIIRKVAEIQRFNKRDSGEWGREFHFITSLLLADP